MDFRIVDKKMVDFYKFRYFNISYILGKNDFVASQDSSDLHCDGGRKALGTEASVMPTSVGPSVHLR